jgi:hypothetical protein
MAMGYNVEPKKKTASTAANAQKKTAAGKKSVMAVGMNRGINFNSAAANSRSNAAEHGRVVRSARAIEKKHNIANSAVVNKPKKESGTARKRIVK